MTELPTPPTGADAVAWVAEHLGDLVLEQAAEVRASATIAGGQQAADRALATFDVTGYAARRNEVWPPKRRGASRLSPYIRHGLLTLPTVWDHVDGGPYRDVEKFRDELLWQEYARHLYARTAGTDKSLRYAVRERGPGAPVADDGWDPEMACLALVSDELANDGWLVNQTRMWMASHWTVRGGWGWRDGEDVFFQHLLDGSRAANRLGWQWTVGAGTGKPYGFSRSQVTKRAPGVCDGCVLRRTCPIEQWPADVNLLHVEPVAGVAHDANAAATAGPTAHPDNSSGSTVVWLTAESLGDADPALAANPELPVVFVFDEKLLRRIQLSSKRIIFLTQALAELAEGRSLRVYRGEVADVLAGERVAVTHTPVPGWRRRSAEIDVVATYPWPWLVRPHAGPAGSFSAWRRGARR